jgi:hypothetical protein
MRAGAEALAKLAPSARSAHERDLDGAARPYTQQSMKTSLFQVKQHMEAHLGLGYDVSKLAHVQAARKKVAATLGVDKALRALSLDDELQSEGWRNFDPAYAADSYMMGLTGFGEAMAPRCSDTYVARRTHFKSTDVHGGTRAGWRWRRFSGKSNRMGNRRDRTFAHPQTCRRHGDGVEAGPTLCSLEESCVQFEEGLGMLPETRCGPCSLERLWELADADCDPTADAGLRAAFRAPVGKALFSWEKGAVPMAKRADGSYDGRGWFKDRGATVAELNALFRRYGKRINERRTEVDASVPHIPLALFRTHSMRHGAVLNLKRMRVAPSEGAAHVCMSLYMWENVYGLELAQVIGEEFTGAIAGSAAKRPRTS